MTTFLVVRHQSGPRWKAGRPLEEQSDWPAHAAFMDELVDAGFVLFGGPLPGGRVAFAVEAESEAAVHATLARDPWSDSHLHRDSVEHWTIRLDGRNRH